MASNINGKISEAGAVFLFGKLSEDISTKFWVKNDEIIEIACGEDHTIVVSKNGRAFSFGKNDYGQLGLGDKVYKAKPTCMKNLKRADEKVILVACGRNHTLLYTATGNIFGCGFNSENQIIPGYNHSILLPTKLHGWTPQNVKQIAAGGEYSAIVSEHGRLYMWGCNDDGQLGLEKNGTYTSPNQVDLPGPVRWVACGHHHTGVVLADGRVFMWGEGESGKLGAGSAVLDTTVFKPMEVETSTLVQEPVIRLACGQEHTLAVTQSGRVLVWGEGSMGQLGLGVQCLRADTPRLMEALEYIRVRKVSAGEAHSAVLTDFGTVLTFGDGRSGIRGDMADFANQLRPFRLPGFAAFTVELVECGAHHLAIQAKLRSGSNSSVSIDNGSMEEEDDNPLDALAARSLRPVDPQKRLGRRSSGGELELVSARFRRRNGLNKSRDNLNSTLPNLKSNDHQGSGNHFDNSKINLSATLPNLTRRSMDTFNGGA